MSGSVNKVVIIGNVGQDPEVRTTEGGAKIVTISVATSERWSDRNTGEKKEKVDWHRCVLFGSRDNDGLAGIAEKYVRKGSKVYVEGKLQTRKWQHQDGSDRYTTEIVLNGFGAQLVLLDGKGEGGGNRPPPPNGTDDYGRTSSSGGASHSGGSRTSDAYAGGMDDDIPFDCERRG